jgi:hypothetical protein
VELVSRTKREEISCKDDGEKDTVSAVRRGAEHYPELDFVDKRIGCKRSIRGICMSGKVQLLTGGSAASFHRTHRRWVII